MRFANASDRSKPKLVAKSPTLPTQKDPGHRYGRGMVLPGASMKGSHVVEIKVQGTSRHSRTSPHREDRGDPSTFNDSYYSRRSRSRSVSPSSAGSTDLTVTTSRSQYSTNSMHLSSAKPFEKPERKNRAYNLKGPLPDTPNKVSLNNEGLSVNAEVISVSNTAYPPSNSGGASVRSSSSRSRSNSPAKSVASASASVASAASAASAASRSSRVSATSYRSNYSKYTNTLTLSSLNDLTTSSLYQSLATNHAAYASNGSQIHNLQLSQHAYKHIRKSQVRGAIAQFLQEEEDYQSLPPGQVNIFSSAASLPPHQGQSYLASGQTVATTASEQFRTNQKKQLYTQKLIDNLRSSIWTELEAFKDVTPATVCFPSYNMHMEAMEACRTELYQIVMNWQVKYVRDIVGLLDNRIVKYSSIQQAKARLLARHQQVDDRRAKLFARRAELKRTLQILRRQAEERGLAVDNLLMRFPGDWFMTDNDFDNPQGYCDLLEDDPQSLRNYLENSVFLSPDKMAAMRERGRDVGEREEEEEEEEEEEDIGGYYDEEDGGEEERGRQRGGVGEEWRGGRMAGYEEEGIQDVAMTSYGRGMDQSIDLHGVHRLGDTSYSPASTNPMDRFAVDFNALRLLSAQPTDLSTTVSESLATGGSAAGELATDASPPPPPSSNASEAGETGRGGRLVCYNINPDEIEWPAQASTPSRARRVSGNLPRPSLTPSRASPEREKDTPTATSNLRPLSPGASLAATHKIDLHYLAYSKDPRPVSPSTPPSASPQSTTRKYALYIGQDARSISTASASGSVSTAPGSSAPLKVLTPKKRIQPPAALSDFS